MEYMDVKEAAKRWGLTDRRIRILCNEGRIDGAVRLGWSWMIPASADKPSDGRVLRKFTNLDLRPGSVDATALRRLKEDYPMDGRLKASSGFIKVISSSLYSMLSISGLDITEKEISLVLSGSVVPALSLEEHLLISSFKSILFRFLTPRGRWSEKDAAMIRSSLMQGIEDPGNGYRKGFTRYLVRDREKVSVEVQMETVFLQYERQWNNLNELVAGTILFGEIMRVDPYERYSMLFAYLIMAGETMRKGLLPPLMNRDTYDEAKAAFSVAVSKGAYGDFTSYMERAVLSSYKVVFGNV